MGLMQPAEPDFDFDDWAQRPYFARLGLMCRAWAMQGFGAPGVAYLFYVLKLLLYVGGFVLFATATPGVGGVSEIGTWWSEPIVFQKAVLWTLLYESVGLGCGSGPLTGRYIPPVTAVAYWLRPGTIRLPPFRRIPLTRGDRRSIVDVALYAVFVGLVLRALLAASMSRGVVIPILVTFVVLGLRDKTVFLSARSEHYLLTVVVFLFPADLIAGSKAVQVALWWGAASSKLNHHFPSVISVMMSNNPLLRSRRIRRALYRDYPRDMRVSRLTRAIAHGATVVEYTFPVLLVFGTGGALTEIGLVVMVVFHLIILTSFPMGVPLEWNVFFIYSGLVLFGAYADVRLWSIGAPALIAVLVLCLVAIPVLGNLRPDKVSFLPSMRYYAGNWAVGVWLLRPGLLETAGATVTTSAPTPRRQLDRLYGVGAYEQVVGRIQAFRSMHLHGRALNALLPLAVEDLDDSEARAKGLDAFEAIDGEMIAGFALGWNFGDGHLHHEQLIDALQARCAFEPGQVRCVLLESQPAGSPSMRWRIVDAADGPVASGEVVVADLLDLQPWGGDVRLRSGAAGTSH